MEPLFVFCSILVVYSGYLTFCDLLKTEKKAVTYAMTELKVVERAGRMMLVLFRRHLAVGRNNEGAHFHMAPVSRSTT